MEQHVRNFLRAVDRGDFGERFIVGPSDDRGESCFVRALRLAIAYQGRERLAVELMAQGITGGRA